MGDEGGDGRPLLSLLRDRRSEAGSGTGGGDLVATRSARPSGDPLLGGGFGQLDPAPAGESMTPRQQQVEWVVHEYLLVEATVGGLGDVGERLDDGQVGVAAEQQVEALRRVGFAQAYLQRRISV